MCEVARIIGGAGTGKTTRLLHTMEKLIARGYDPREIGFVSFTRAARSEAASRAALAFNLNPAELEVGGWFRTVHSIAYKQLGVGQELLAGTRKDLEWIQSAVGEEISGTADVDDDGNLSASDREPTRADHALSLWTIARNRMVPLAEQHKADGDYSLGEVREIVERYEQAKRLDGRCDFTDLISRFSGVRFSLDDATDCLPEGQAPPIRVLFADEQQDSSALLDRATQRLAEGADYAYLCLDPFQSIYGFAGASASHAMAWDVREANRHVLPKSYRCPAAILSLGEDILRGCSDYWDRGIAPADHAGEVETNDFRSGWTHEVDPRESWLLIARTNHQAKRIAARLNHDGIPWIPTKGNGGWLAPARNAAVRAMRQAERDLVLTPAGWVAITKQIPSKCPEGELLKRGAKTQATKIEETTDLVPIDLIDDWGATPLLKSMLTDGRWRSLVKGADLWHEAARTWGEDAADVDRWPADRGVRVGTIHSVKGAEAANVLLLTTTSARVQRSVDATAEGEDAERRVAYVGVTRAKRRLIVAQEPSAFRLEIPA